MYLQPQSIKNVLIDLGSMESEEQFQENNDQILLSLKLYCLIISAVWFHWIKHNCDKSKYEKISWQWCIFIHRSICHFLIVLHLRFYSCVLMGISMRKRLGEKAPFLWLPFLKHLSLSPKFQRPYPHHTRICFSEGMDINLFCALSFSSTIYIPNSPSAITKYVSLDWAVDHSRVPFLISTICEFALLSVFSFTII